MTGEEATPKLVNLTSLSETDQQLLCKSVIASLGRIKNLTRDLLKQTHNTSGSDLHNSRHGIQVTALRLQDEIDTISKIIAGNDSDYYSQHFRTVYLWLSSMYKFPPFNCHTLLTEFCDRRVIRDTKSFISISKKIYNNQMDYVAREQQHFYQSVLIERCGHTSAAFQIIENGERDNTGQSFRNIVNQADIVMNQIEELLSLALAVGTSQLLAQNRIVTQEVLKLDGLLLECKVFAGKTVLDETCHNVIVSAKDLAKKCVSHPLYVSEEASKVKRRTMDDIFDLLVSAQQKILHYTFQGGSLLHIDYRPPRPPRADKGKPSNTIRKSTQKLDRAAFANNSVKQFATVHKSLKSDGSGDIDKKDKSTVLFAGEGNEEPTRKLVNSIDGETLKPAKKSKRKHSIGYKTLNDDQLQSFKHLKHKFKSGCQDLGKLKKSPRGSSSARRRGSSVSGEKDVTDDIVSKLVDIECLDISWRTDEKLKELREILLPLLSSSNDSSSGRSKDEKILNITEKIQTTPEPVRGSRRAQTNPADHRNSRRTVSGPCGDELVVISKWKKSSGSKQNVLELGQTNTLRKLIVPLASATKSFIESIIQASRVPDGNRNVKDTVNEIYSILNNLLVHTNDTRLASIFETPPLQLIEKAPLEGSKDEELIANIANDRPIIGKKFFYEFIRNIQNMGKTLESLIIQLAWTVKSMLQTVTGVSQSFVVQIMTFVYSIIDLLTKMLNAQATSSYLSLYFQDVVDSEAPAARGNSSSDPLADFWDSIDPDSCVDSLSDGNLHRIIYSIIEPAEMDNNRLEIFLMTYLSFTDPKELVNSLISCHNIPTGVFSIEKVTEMKLRIYRIIRDWLHFSFLDLNDSILNQIEEFVDFSVLDVRETGELKNLIEITRRKLASVESLWYEPQRLEFSVAAKLSNNETMSHADMFLHFEAAEIAEALTFHDFELFKAIKSHELLEQCWSKPKSKHRASNLLAVVHQLNKVSYWIPSLVLWKSSLNERARMLTKIISIAVELRKLNNFSGVMAFLAGINLACMFRLKFTFMAIGEEISLKLKDLQELMDPTKSWKNYRTALALAGFPAVPYLGLYLSDLTQIYEGNESKTADVIHFEKQVLVAKVIKQIQVLQSHPYGSLRVNEHQMVFTSGLPLLDDSDLWELSLLREPRDANIEDLLDA